MRTLRGTYIFAASGFNIVAGVAQPKAIVEVIEFNGDGTLSVPAATLSANGVIVRPSNGIGTYTVADDCSGTILFAGPAFDIFVSRDAEAISDDPDQSKHRLPRDGDTDIARPRRR